MLIKIFAGFVFTVLLGLTSVARSAVEPLWTERIATRSTHDEALYLPDGRALKFISFGYRNALSDLLWFTTVSYFGKHFRKDQNYIWLGHMCDLVSRLNPHASHVYEFCGMMLAWEAGEPARAIEILNRAVRNSPENWYYLYLRGIIHTIFSKDVRSAKEDFIRAAKLPGAHRLVARLAARNIALLESPETAIEFLEQMLSTTSDPSMRAALEMRLDQIREGTMPQGTLRKTTEPGL